MVGWLAVASWIRIGISAESVLSSGVRVNHRVCGGAASALEHAQISGNRGFVNGWTGHDRVFGVRVAVAGVPLTDASGKTPSATPGGSPRDGEPS